jgi:hypothetical protein
MFVTDEVVIFQVSKFLENFQVSIVQDQLKMTTYKRQLFVCVCARARACVYRLTMIKLCINYHNNGNKIRHL